MMGHVYGEFHSSTRTSTIDEVGKTSGRTHVNWYMLGAWYMHDCRCSGLMGYRHAGKLPNGVRPALLLDYQNGVNCVHSSVSYNLY